MKIKSVMLILLLVLPWSQTIAAAETTAQTADETTGFLRLSIDNLVIHTDGVVDASQSLAQSIDRLSASIERLATAGEALNDEDKAALLSAVKSVDRASTAVARLAQQLPQAAQQLTAQLPQILTNARAPIAEISNGLESAREGIFAITEALPEATENAKQLINSALDAALIKLSIYSILLLGLITFAVIAVMWFVYRRYLQPLARKLDTLTGAPEHFDNLSRHMQQTSANLLRLNRGAIRGSALAGPRAQ